MIAAVCYYWTWNWGDYAYRANTASINSYQDTNSLQQANYCVQPRAIHRPAQHGSAGVGVHSKCWLLKQIGTRGRAQSILQVSQFFLRKWRAALDAHGGRSAHDWLPAVRGRGAESRAPNGPVNYLLTLA